MNIFEHNTQELENCTFTISPSLISKFFDYPKDWYEETYLGKTTFFGNNATLTGGICHFYYDCVTKNKDKPNEEDIKNNLINYCVVHNLCDEVNFREIVDNYKAIVPVVVNDYIIPRLSNKTLSEYPMAYALDKEEGIYLAGTCDRIEVDQSMIVDFKTVSKKPNEFAIPFNYKIQLLAYAYLAKKLSVVEPTRIRIVYGVKPQKTIPARCLVVEEPITDTHWSLIEDTLQLMTDTIKYIRKNPESTYLIFKSMELK